jgi:chromosome segregation ATPase
MKGEMLMPTFEERLTALEQNAMQNIHDLQANVTIMMGVIGSQGQDIKRILQRQDVMDSRLSVMDGRLNIVEQHLSQMDGRLNGVEQHLGQMDGRLTGVEQHLSQMDRRLTGVEQHLSQMDEKFEKHTKRFDHVEGMLAQILDRLPEKS